MTIRFRTMNYVLRGLLVLALAATPLFAQITFSDFNDVTNLALNGSAAKATNASGQKVLRLTADGTLHKGGTAWFVTQQSVASGFTSVFHFQIAHDSHNGSGPADGISFVIQNSSLAARGGSGGAIGYGKPDPGDNGTAIPNSLAVEFDTFKNSWDPNANHVAVQSCGTASNSQDHTGNCNLGIVSDLAGITLADGNVHMVIVEYDPGVLRVFLDNSGAPILTVNVDLSTLLNLTNNDDTQSAWVGFGGSTGGSTETNDILDWTFTPATAETSITQTINETPTDYVFGSYNKKFDTGGVAGDVVTVTAIPVDRAEFHERLLNTPFTDAQCLIYDGAGGLCVLFRVQCTPSNNCDNLDYTLFNNFNTSQQNITGAGVLKATIGENNWQNIIESFTQSRNDPGAKSGSKGFSDFILCENCTAAPEITINSPAEGGLYFVGQNIPVSFTCTPDPNAPLVTVTSCDGTLNGQSVSNGGTFTFTEPGPGAMAVTSADTVLNTSSKTASFTVGVAPAITSGNNATFQVGIAGLFLVTTTGSPAPTIGATGALPGSVTFVDNGNGTASLAGTPAANTGGVYNLIISATNGGGTATQNFTLTVNQAPAITSANSATFQVGVANSFTVTTTGFPTPSITETGALPSGVTFTNNGNGTGTLSGTAAASGVFNIAFTAANGVGSATQNFTLTVAGAQVSISPASLNFGDVQFFRLVWKNVTVKNTGTVNLQISKVSVTFSPGQADKDDFTFLNFCSSSLAPGKSCTITVFFFADDLGPRSATLNIFDNAPGSPQQVPLSGNVFKKGK